MLFCWMWLQVNNLKRYNLHSFNFRSNYSSGMRAHVRLVLLGLKPPLYSCWECEYQGSSKSVVIRSIHFLVSSESFSGRLSSHGNAHWSTERLPLAGLRLQIQVRAFLLFFKTKRLNPRWRTTITTHVKEKHGGGKREKCPTCDYTTVRKRNLGKHIRSVHEENSVTNVVTKPSWTPRLNWFVFCICVETFINRYRIVRKMYIMKIIRAVHMSDNGPWKDTRCNL